MVYNSHENFKQQSVNKGNKCLHGIDKGICAYCNGTAKELKKRRVKYVTLP